MRILKTVAGAFALVVATPAIAQDQSVIDDAQFVTAALWPEGAVATMMEDSMAPMMDQVMASMADMPMQHAVRMMEELAESDEQAAEIEALFADMTMGELMEIVDPHYIERQRIAMAILMEEMTPMMVELEPEMRARLAKVMARKYSAEELAAARAFFSSEEGRNFGSKFMSVYSDPEYVEIMGTITPRMMEIMPNVGKRITAEAAHLPNDPDAAAARMKAFIEARKSAE